MTRRYAAILAFLAVAVLPAMAKPNFSGDWKLNTSKSDFGQMPAPQKSTMKIEHKDPALKVATTYVGDNGERTFEMNLSTDGKEVTNTFGNFEFKSKAHWEGSVLLVESRASSDSGEFKADEKWTVSDAGKTLTLVRHWVGPQGEVTNTVVHDKQ